MDRYLSHFKPPKVTKTFHHTETVNNKIHEIYFHVVVLSILPLQMKTKINRNPLNLIVVNFIKE